jgi:hypothetical protein
MVGSELGPRDLNIALGSGKGHFEFGGATSQLIVTGTERLAFTTPFTQTGGYHRVGGDLWTGLMSNMSGGTLIVDGGQAFSGTFNQSGGFVNVTSPSAKHGPYTNYYLSGGSYKSPILQPYGFTWSGGVLAVSTLNLTGTMTVSLNTG